MRPYVHERNSGNRFFVSMVCDCGWSSPTSEGNTIQEAVDTAYILATLRSEDPSKQPNGNEPKKVTHEATNPSDYTCPSCKNVVSEWMGFGPKLFCIQPKFCKFCGQALDWKLEEGSHDPKMCEYSTKSASGELLCMGTKELEQCVGEKCTRWKQREEQNAN